MEVTVSSPFHWHGFRGGFVHALGTRTQRNAVRNRRFRRLILHLMTEMMPG